ncbi:unnamed protein product [Sphacelaria rigidula]
MSGSPTKSALKMVVNSDVRLTALQREAEILEAEAEESAATNPEPPPASTGGGASAAADVTPKNPPQPPTDEASIEDKVARLEEIYEELNLLDAHDAEIRATSILKGLGFSDARISCPTSELSGGWMTRVSLACAIFCRPGILSRGSEAMYVNNSWYYREAANPNPNPNPDQGIPKTLGQGGCKVFLEQSVRCRGSNRGL